MSNYQTTTGKRVFMFTLAAVYADTPTAAKEYALKYGLEGARAAADHNQLSKDMQTAYVYLATRPHGFR